MTGVQTCALPIWRSIFIVDRQKKWLGLPFADAGDYELLQGKYLFQSKAGANFKVLATAEYSSKFKFLMKDNKIDFNHPLIYDPITVSVEYDAASLPAVQRDSQSEQPLTDLATHNTNQTA